MNITSVSIFQVTRVGYSLYYYNFVYDYKLKDLLIRISIPVYSKINNSFNLTLEGSQIWNLRNEYLY